jgi:hypothetical protein
VESFLLPVPRDCSVELSQHRSLLRPLFWRSTSEPSLGIRKSFSQKAIVADGHNVGDGATAYRSSSVT